MKVQEKQNLTKKQKWLNFFNFPKKLNLLALSLIVIVYALLSVGGIVLAAQKEYIVKPNYEEMGASEKVNLFFKLYSNYTVNSNGELKKADTINFCYYGVNNNKTTRVSSWISALFDDNSMVYYDTKDATSTDGTRTGVQYLSSGTNQEKYPTEIYCSANYDVVGDSNAYSVQFSKKILTLTKKEMKLDVANDFSGASYKVVKDNEEKIIKIFKDFKVTAAAPTSESTDKVNKITVKFTLNTEATNKYVLDLQVFAVDDDKQVYNLIGFYNLSNNTLQTYSNTSSVSTEIDVEYVYVKANYVDQNGELHELFFKTSFKNILN